MDTPLSRSHLPTLLTDTLTDLSGIKLSACLVFAAVCRARARPPLLRTLQTPHTELAAIFVCVFFFFVHWQRFQNHSELPRQSGKKNPSEGGLHIAEANLEGFTARAVGLSVSAQSHQRTSVKVSKFFVNEFIFFFKHQFHQIAERLPNGASGGYHTT